MSPKPVPSFRGRRAQRGALLLETLVAILIFAFGVLGVVGLQVSMMRAQTSAKFRADAIALTNEYLGLLWVDSQANRAKYTTADCDDHAACLDWKRKVEKTLPGAAIELDTDAVGGAVRVRLQWTVPNEGSHSYEANTNVL